LTSSPWVERALMKRLPSHTHNAYPEVTTVTDAPQDLPAPWTSLTPDEADRMADRAWSRASRLFVQAAQEENRDLRHALREEAFGEQGFWEAMRDTAARLRARQEAEEKPWYDGLTPDDFAWWQWLDDASLAIPPHDCDAMRLPDGDCEVCWLASK
jgi:hypothetical protein